MESVAIEVGREQSDARTDRITPRCENFMQWYNDVIAAADLVDEAPVRGCKIYKPNGFALWEAIQNILNPQIQDMDVQNVYFPLLIPLGFMAREAEHVEGFAKECAVVTHHRLKAEGGTIAVDSASELAEPYVIRPTSETVIWDSFSRWIRSYRDLPLKVNQWCNVMRWEHQTRTFLRGAEFLWQEGHTAHASAEEAEAQARQVLDVYVAFAQEQLCLPLIPGRKSARERFAGAEETYTMEVLAQNGMSIQAGTSHFLGQKFAKAFNTTYQDQSNCQHHVWGTSWGVSTRLIGALITSLSDDSGLVLPAAVAPTQVVIIAMFTKDATKNEAVLVAAKSLCKTLRASGLRVRFDERTDIGLVQKRYLWERRGVPLRLEMGARDLDSNSVVAKLRTGGDKFSIPLESSDTALSVHQALEDARASLCARSHAMKERLTFEITSKVHFEERLQQQVPGYLLVPWGGDSEDEAKLQQETGATLRCHPFEQRPLADNQLCPLTGKIAREWAVFAKAY